MLQYLQRKYNLYIVFVLTETFKILESTPEMRVVGLDTHDELYSHREADKPLQGRVFGAYDWRCFDSVTLITVLGMYIWVTSRPKNLIVLRESLVFTSLTKLTTIYRSKGNKGGYIDILICVLCVLCNRASRSTDHFSLHAITYTVSLPWPFPIPHSRPSPCFVSCQPFPFP